MSKLNKTIISNKDFELMINCSGIKEGIIKEEDFSLEIYAFTIDGNPIFSHSLSIVDTRNLYNYLNELSIIRDNTNISKKIIEIEEDIEDIIDNIQKLDISVLSKILNKFNQDEKIPGLISFLSIEELKNLESTVKYSKYKKELENLNKLLELEENYDIKKEILKYSELSKYKAGQSEKIFQNWIEENIWIFGIDYIRKHEARQIAFFSIADLLMESSNGFLDLIELKRPKFKLFKYDNDHKCYYLTDNISKAIGQSLFYLQKLFEFKMNIEKEYSLNILYPQIKVIVGRSNNFNEQETNTLRNLNMNLNHIKFITYDQLLEQGKLLLSHYSTK